MTPEPLPQPPPPAAAPPVLPDYEGANVSRLVPSLLGDADRSWLPEPAQRARAVVLLVVDGLGWDVLRDHRQRLSLLAALEGGPITTVVPSTTAAALTSIATGAPPAAHGILGYRIRVEGRSLNVLRWQAAGDTAPDPVEVQPLPPFAGRRVPVVTKAEFRRTGFTAAHLRGSHFKGWRTTSALVELVRRSVAAGASFVYAYYDGLDKVAHEYGRDSDVFATELVYVERIVADILARLPAGAALLVTADHGQVDVGPGRAVALDAVSSLVAAYSGEGRFRGLHARSGAVAELLSACQELYADRAWVFSRDRLFDEGWVGRGGGPIGRGRVGDVLLAAREPVVFADPGQEQETRMIAQHGSLTAAEVEVPLLAAWGG